MADATSVNDIILKQLDRLEERTRDMVTRHDLDQLRRDLVTRDALEPQLSALKARIERLESDRTTDKKETNERIDELETELFTRSDKLWIRLSQLVAVAGFIIALFDFLTHLKLLP